MVIHKLFDGDSEDKKLHEGIVFEDRTERGAEEEFEQEGPARQPVPMTLREQLIYRLGFLCIGLVALLSLGVTAVLLLVVTVATMLTFAAVPQMVGAVMTLWRILTWSIALVVGSFFTVFSLRRGLRFLLRYFFGKIIEETLNPNVIGVSKSIGKLSKRL